MQASNERDIYEVLGISRRAGPALAREMYWTRVNEHLDAERRGESGARQQIEALNEALAIVVDDRLRAEYDAQHRGAGREAEPIVDPLPAPRRRMRAVLVLVFLVAALAATFLTYVLAGPVAALGVLLAALAFLLLAALGIRREHRERVDAFELLQLRGGASMRELEVAYRSRVDELLGAVRRNPRAFSQLDALDRAYLHASAVVLARQAEPAVGAERSEDAASEHRGSPAWREWAVRLVRASAAAARRAARAAWAQLRLWIGAAGAWLWRRIRGGVRASSRVRVQRPHISVSSHAAEIATADVARRLSTVLRTASAETEEQAPRADDSVEATAAPAGRPVSVEREARPAAFLLLESAAGTRRVPVGGTPVRIGSDPGCDLVLPADQGVAAEHVYVWQRGGMLVLHVVDPGATCLVNEEPASWAGLDDGDVVRVGETALRIERASR